MNKSFTCKCGREHKFPPYVFAHWDEALTFTCPNEGCGRQARIKNGKVSWEPVLVGDDEDDE